ncbi:hypothetical protein BS47DRAFT_1399804 [Hydnum rufescens UP504]|uniref:Uncharacterized protein n=1 Tax=Hydnum rufescens UP504 TaxID=1448309 RepID=A0A9P6AHU1_9AGAM|nr:hypothetical protein BS47DRAFT_1399804 [Hydnum rufescens UP504]
MRQPRKAKYLWGPRRYLAFLGWCIFGTVGELARALNSAALELDGVLDDDGLYQYVVNGGDFGRMVDLEVIKQRSSVPSETTNTRDAFRDSLLERDECCVFRGVSRGHGIRIIPPERGSGGFRGIIDNRPNDEEDVDDLIDINDIRNDPNRSLDKTDIPCADRPLKPRPGLAYARDVRYTLQWLGEPDKYMFLITPNNLDATFIQSTKKRKPSRLLLHYNYGAAAVKRWGHGLEALDSQLNPARPAGPMGAPRTVRDRGVTIQEHGAAQYANETNSMDVGTQNQPA